MRVRKKELGDWWENGNEDEEPKMQPLHRKICDEIGEYEGEKQWLAKQRKCMAVFNPRIW